MLSTAKVTCIYSVKDSELLPLGTGGDILTAENWRASGDILTVVNWSACGELVETYWQQKKSACGAMVETYWQQKTDVRVETFWQQKTEVSVGGHWWRHTDRRKLKCVWSTGGDMLTADNWSVRRKACPVPLCPPCIPYTTGWIAYPRLRDDRPATERLNHGPACDVLCRETNSWRNMTKCWQHTPNNVKSTWHWLHSEERKAVMPVRLSGQFSLYGILQVDVLIIHYGSDNSDYWPPWPITKCT
jgi:hypothetical protein